MERALQRELGSNPQRGVEETLTTALGEQHYITQEELEKVMQWKLNTQHGRRDRYIKWMSEVPTAFVQRISEAALLVDDPKLQLKPSRQSMGSGLRPPQLFSQFMIQRPT
ncbi:hypothetical protein HacjB3_16896 (plasmid) [Halalkalicoccus jeotgali B3]|uniref:Uncharacterized protein n=1 Tax=Halalkalicoccus jeotgali (strain DSM 18796 / CECT 7217 / JCM 14584 / KCTC 4019 / B3) TaxID=795797 RepID=D8JBS6_HALJB|nr:hypothetical protein HacjB3_16896 [Halalkalicoccus jeotgali B3]